jgi:hypothetical protein
MKKIILVLLSLFIISTIYSEPKIIVTKVKLLPAITVAPIVPKYCIYYELPKTEWAGYVIDQCKKYNVPIWLAFRLIYRESHNKTDAVNINYDPTTGKILSHDIGLGQLCDRYIESYYEWKFNGDKHINPFNVYDNIHITIQILAWAFNCSGTYEETLEIYNGGYGSWYNKELTQHTIDYMKDILYSTKLYEQF